MVEDRMNPKRECPIPKPGGLVGQVLGMKGKQDRIEEGSVREQVERLRRTRSEDDQ